MSGNEIASADIHRLRNDKRGKNDTFVVFVFAVAVTAVFFVVITHLLIYPHIAQLLV